MCRPPPVPLPMQGSTDPYEFAKYSGYVHGSGNHLRSKLYGGPQELDEVRSGGWPQVMAASLPGKLDASSQVYAHHHGSWQTFNQNGLDSLDAPGSRFQESCTYPKLSLKRSWSNFQSENDGILLGPMPEDSTPERPVSRQAFRNAPGVPSHPNCIPATAIRNSSRPRVAPTVLSETKWGLANRPVQMAFPPMTSQPVYSQTEQDRADTEFAHHSRTWLPYHSALQQREAGEEMPSQEGPEVTDEFREGDNCGLTSKKIRRTLSNRESAKRSRQRRQERLKELEYVTVAMRAELASVGQQFEAAYHQATKYKLENDVLHMEVQRLRSEMRDTEDGKIYFSDIPDCLPNIANTSAAKQSLLQFESDSTFSGHRIRAPKKELSLDAPSSISGQEKTAVPFLLEESAAWHNFGLPGGGVIPTDISNVAEPSVDNAGGEGCSKDDMWFQDLVLGLPDP